jgi:hypothetical protein
MKINSLNEKFLNNFENIFTFVPQDAFNYKRQFINYLFECYKNLNEKIIKK